MAGLDCMWGAAVDSNATREGKEETDEEERDRPLAVCLSVSQCLYNIRFLFLYLLVQVVCVNACPS